MCYNSAMTTTYSKEIKATVMAAILTGLHPSQIAREFNIPIGTVKAWKYRQESNGGVAIVTVQKKEAIGELISDYLTELLKTLRIQMRVFADEKWLKQQSAHEVAILHGVLADKGIRLLEALSEREDNSPIYDGESDRLDSI